MHGAQISNTLKSRITSTRKLTIIEYRGKLILRLFCASQGYTFFVVI